MDFFAERAFYAMVAADVAMLVFFCALCLYAARRARQELVPAAAEASCPTSEESRPSSTSS